MNTAVLTREQREAKLEGMGCKRKRVEDIRFTQGKGNYVDDLKLPGMLFGDFVRSQYAHARVKRIDTSKALKVPGVLAVLTAEELKGVNLAWMPTLAQRRADGAGRRQGAVPEPGGGLRRRRGPLCRRRRRGGRRGGIRGAARHRRSLQGHGARCACAARGPRRQDLGRARPPQAPQPHLRVVGRRQGRHRRRVRRRRGDDQGADLLPPHAPLPARDLPVRGLIRQDQGRADGLRHVPGAARHPHGGLADLQDPRAQDPRDLARHRRRLRQQGGRLSRLHLRHRRLDRDGQAGEVGGGQDREPDDHLVRTRLSYDDRDRGHQGRQGHRPARVHDRRPRRLRCLRQPVEVPGRPVRHRHGLLRFSRRPRGCGCRLHQQGAGRCGLPLLAAGHGSRLCDRARHGYPRTEARAWIRPSCA